MCAYKRKPNPYFILLSIFRREKCSGEIYQQRLKEHTFFKSQICKGSSHVPYKSIEDKFQF